jgi:hypothetical protein
MVPATYTSLEEFDFDHVRGLKCEAIARLGILDLAAARGTWRSSTARHRQPTWPPASTRAPAARPRSPENPGLAVERQIVEVA